MTADKSAAVVVHEDVSALAPRGDAAQVLAMIQSGVERGLSVESMSQMFDLYQRVKASQAEESFNRDFVAFQSECPAAPKSSVASFSGRGGNTVSYAYADLETLMDVARPFLFKHGFSLSFTSEMQGAVLVRRCTVRHRDGHSTHADAPVSTSSSNPGMSDQQKYAGAETSASRRALVAVLGLPLTDAEPENARDQAKVNAEQAASLQALIEEVRIDRAKWLAHYEVASVGDLPASLYAKAVQSLEARRKAGKS